MKVIAAPGVYAPQGDTELLMRTLAMEDLPPGERLLDLCTGTGIVAVAAARRGVQATAVDICGAAVAAARLNAYLHGCRLRLLHGDLTRPVAGERFDVVTANPPYVPAPSSRAAASGEARSWDAGPAGRLVLDRICRAAPFVLAPRGVLLLVQSSLAGVETSLAQLRRAGLRARIVARSVQPYGPVMTARAAWFEQSGLVAAGTSDEELLVIRAGRDGARMTGAERRGGDVTSSTRGERAA